MHRRGRFASGAALTVFAAAPDAIARSPDAVATDESIRTGRADRAPCIERSRRAPVAGRTAQGRARRSFDRIKDKDIEMNEDTRHRYCPDGRSEDVDAGIDGYRTFVEVARRHAVERADAPFLTWLENGRDETVTYSFGELDRRSRAFAARLQALRAELGAGDVGALIVTQPGPGFVLGFFGCLYAGIPAVPAYPPRKNETSARLSLLIRDANARIVIADRASVAALAKFDDLPQDLRIVAVEDLDPSLVDAWVEPEIDRDSIAFIQYTSGSTGLPKGVEVSHGNLVRNERMVVEAMSHDAQTVFVGWLPLFHDMGLIGNLLHPFFLGVRCVLMPPAAFVTNPLRWLQAITRYRATTSGGPNFGYDMCVNRIPPEQREGLDLSSWKVAFNGAEPIRADTLDRFVDAFAPHGFRRETFYPCYGMAEATLFVTGCPQPEAPKVIAVDKRALEHDRAEPRADAAPGETVRLVGSGRRYQDCEVRIVHPETRVECAEGQVGEIWIAGASVARGYRNRPELSEEIFRATIEGDASGKRYLRTGDLGTLIDGELYVTGRSKDLIIISGRNHYPQDIEATAIAIHPALAECKAAAFSIDGDEGEALVVVVGLAGNAPESGIPDALLQAMRAAIVRQHSVAAHDIVVCNDRLPMTSSGKIQRGKCRQLYRDDALAVIASLVPRQELAES
jgi:acyl-CoA synthetase (AMP-forming)/AMP-acid ligase II